MKTVICKDYREFSARANKGRDLARLTRLRMRWRSLAKNTGQRLRE